MFKKEIFKNKDATIGNQAKYETPKFTEEEIKKSQLTYEKVFDLSHIQEHNFKTMRCQFCL